MISTPVGAGEKGDSRMRPLQLRHPSAPTSESVTRSESWWTTGGRSLWARCVIDSPTLNACPLM
jgi:hypothetical protein